MVSFNRITFTLVLNQIKNKVREHDDRITDAENAILILKSLGNSGNSSGNDGKPGFMDALEILIENLRKECYAKFAEKDDFNVFKSRVSALEDHVKRLDDDAKNQYTSLS